MALCSDDCGSPFRCHAAKKDGSRCGHQSGKFRRHAAASGGMPPNPFDFVCWSHLKEEAPAKTWAREERADESLSWRWCLATWEAPCWPNPGCVIGDGDLIAAYETGGWGHIACWKESGIADPPDPWYEPKPARPRFYR